MVAAKASMSVNENYAMATAMMRQLEDVLQYSAVNTTSDLDIQFKSVDRCRPTIVCSDGLLPSVTSISCGQSTCLLTASLVFIIVDEICYISQLL